MVIVKPVYYLLLVVMLLTLAVIVPLKLSESAQISYANTQLSALKAETNSQYVELNDPRVREILSSGNRVGNEKYKHYSSLFGLLASIIALGVVYFFKHASRYDAIYILALFALLFALGSIKSEYFALIAALSLAAFYLKSRKAKPPPTDNLPAA